MNETVWRPTIEAVENELLSGMYYKYDQQTEMPAIQVFPEDTWKTKLKRCLKNNRIIYGIWLKYKHIHQKWKLTILNVTAQ